MYSPSYDDEVLFDDLIQLSYEEASVHDMQFIDKGIIDLDTSEDCEITGEHVTHPSPAPLATLPATTPYNIKNISIKLIDCFKFSWYFDKKTQDIIDMKVADSKVQLSSGDIMYLNTTVHSILDTHETTKLSNAKEQTIRKMKIKNDKEIFDAITKKNKTEIDLKRNIGLVGFKIQRKQTKEVADGQTDVYKVSNEQDKMKEGYAKAVDKALFSIGTTITPAFEEKTNIIKPNECIPHNIANKTNATPSVSFSCKLKIPADLENTLKEAKDDVEKMNKKENKVNETTRAQNNMIADQIMYVKMTEILNKYDGKIDETTLTKINKSSKKNRRSYQKNVEGSKTTKLIQPLPISSKTFKRLGPVKNTSKKCGSNELKISTTQHSFPQPSSQIENTKPMDKVAGNAVVEETSGDKNKKYNPHPLDEIEKLMSAEKKTHPIISERSPVPNTFNVRRKQSFKCVGENIRHIEDYLEMKQKPIESAVKKPVTDKFQIHTIETNQTDMGSKKEGHNLIHGTPQKPLPPISQIPAIILQTGQGQSNPQVTRPLNVYNSIEAHILYRPQNGYRPRMFPNTRYKDISVPQRNLAQFIYQQTVPQMVSNAQMNSGIYDVRPNKMCWPYTYPPPPLPPPPPPPPPPKPISHPQEVKNLSSTEAQSDSIIGRNNAGIVKKINITKATCLKTKEAEVKTENYSNSTPLYDEISECSTLTTKMGMLLELDTCCMQRINNTPVKNLSPTFNDSHENNFQVCPIAFQNKLPVEKYNNLKRTIPADFVDNTDDSRSKLLYTRRDPSAIDLKKKTAETIARSNSYLISSKTKDNSRTELFVPKNTTDTKKVHKTKTTKIAIKPDLNTAVPYKSLSQVVRKDKRLEAKVDHFRPDKRPVPDSHGCPSKPASNISTEMTLPTHKPGPLSKKSKLIDPKVSAVKEVPSKGYSPPILPIPTYESILPHSPSSFGFSSFDILIDEKPKDNGTRKYKDVSLNGTDKMKNKLKYERNRYDVAAKKISFDEYKKRGCITDEAKTNKHKGLNTKDCEMPRHPSSIIDLDLGYDSDSTVKL